MKSIYNKVSYSLSGFITRIQEALDIQVIDEHVI